MANPTPAEAAATTPREPAEQPDEMLLAVNDVLARRTGATAPKPEAAIAAPTPASAPAPAGEPEPEPTPAVNGEVAAPEPEATPEPEPSAPEPAPVDDEAAPIEGVPPEVQAKIQERFDTLTAKRKVAEDALATAQTESTTLRQQNEELTRTVEELRSKGAVATVAAAGIHPAFAMQSPRQIADYEKSRRDLKAFCLKHWDGVEAEGDKPGYTAEQIREAYAGVDEELQTVIPAARKVLEQRLGYDGTVKRVMPQLLDAKSDEHRRMQTMFERHPSLLAEPDIKVFMAAMFKGLKLIREELAKPAAPPPTVPRVSLAPKPAARAITPAAPKPQKQEGPRMDVFLQGGRTRDSLAASLLGVV